MSEMAEKQKTFFMVSGALAYRIQILGVNSRIKLWNGSRCWTCGGYLGAYLGGRKGYQACAIGFGLMPQGAMGIILASLALEFSLINETVFVALVSTALVPSILSGPLIKWAMARQPLNPI